MTKGKAAWKAPCQRGASERGNETRHARGERRGSTSSLGEDTVWCRRQRQQLEHKESDKMHDMLVNTYKGMANCCWRCSRLLILIAPPTLDQINEKMDTITLIAITHLRFHWQSCSCAQDQRRSTTGKWSGSTSLEIYHRQTLAHRRPITHT